MKKIAIISCNKWKDKIFEDNLIKKALINKGYKAEIISWEENNNYFNYDALLIRSVWGYQNKYEEFKKWLLYLKKNNIKVFNNVDLILNNIRKDIQFNILKNNNIDIINTRFINDITDLIKCNNCVIKPSISGSGNNTYHIEKYFSKDTIENLSELLKNKELKIMVQPYIKGISEGEYSVIYINHEMTHVMKRYPGILYEKRKTEMINDTPSEIIKLADKVEKIIDFKDYLYIRIDIVIDKKKAKVMEVELCEPDLLTKYIDKPELQQKIVNKIVEAIESKI